MTALLLTVLALACAWCIHGAAVAEREQRRDDRMNDRGDDDE